MNLLQRIRSAHDGEALRALGRRFGLSEGETEQALRALVPEFGQALRRGAGTEEHAGAIHGLIQDRRYRRYLEDPGALDARTAGQDGERLLGEIFANDVERQAAARRAAGTAGLTPETVEHLMPLAAALIVGALGGGQAEPSPTVPGHFGTDADDAAREPLARVLASAFGDEEVSLKKQP